MDLPNTVKTTPLVTYREEKIGKTVYCVTSVYLGKGKLAKILEELAIRKILREESIATI